jgi:hypothetical protein
LNAHQKPAKEDFKSTDDLAASNFTSGMPFLVSDRSLKRIQAGYFSYAFLCMTGIFSCPNVFLKNAIVKPKPMTQLSSCTSKTFRKKTLMQFERFNQREQVFIKEFN